MMIWIWFNNCNNDEIMKSEAKLSWQRMFDEQINKHIRKINQQIYDKYKRLSSYYCYLLTISSTIVKAIILLTHPRVIEELGMRIEGGFSQGCWCDLVLLFSSVETIRSSKFKFYLSVDWMLEYFRKINVF